MIRFYGYPKCSTCRKARKKLLEQGIDFSEYDITKTPPSRKILNDLLKNSDYELKDLFNRSGQLYRAMNLKEKLAGMSKTEALDLLSRHGKLVKRPVVTNGVAWVVGYDEDRLNRMISHK